MFRLRRVHFGSSIGDQFAAPVVTSNPALPPADASDAEIEMFVKSSAALQRLEIAPAFLDPVEANIRILLQHASRITDFPPERGIEAPADSLDRLSK